MHALFFIALAAFPFARGARSALRRSTVGLAILSAFIGTALGMSFLMAALHQGEVGLVSTLSSMTPVLILPMVWIRSGKRPSAPAWLGALVAIAGTALISVRVIGRLPARRFLTSRLQDERAGFIPCGMCEDNSFLNAALDRPGRRGRARRNGVTTALAASALCSVLILAAPATAQSPMIQGWLAVNAQCKTGPADDPKVQQACKTRDRLNDRLKRRGCIYQADGDWWRCQH